MKNTRKLRPILFFSYNHKNNFRAINALKSEIAKYQRFVNILNDQVMQNNKTKVNYVFHESVIDFKKLNDFDKNYQMNIICSNALDYDIEVAENCIEIELPKVYINTGRIEKAVEIAKYYMSMQLIELMPINDRNKKLILDYYKKKNDKAIMIYNAATLHHIENQVCTNQLLTA